MGDENQTPFEDDDLDSLEDFDDELDDPDDDSIEEKLDPVVQARINARHEIERRNELKALKSELDEWDELDEYDL